MMGRGDQATVQRFCFTVISVFSKNVALIHWETGKTWAYHDRAARAAAFELSPFFLFLK
jgi:hypothetical protein